MIHYYGIIYANLEWHGETKLCHECDPSAFEVLKDSVTLDHSPGDFFGRPLLTLLELYVSMCLFRVALCELT